VATFGGDAAAGEKLFFETMPQGGFTEGFDAIPNFPQVDCLLFLAPVLSL